MACVDLPPSVDRGEASVGVSAFLVPLGIDNAADGGFARPAPAPTTAISVGTGEFCSNVVGLHWASLPRRMAASHVQLRLPRRRYPLERESYARTSLGFARHRLCGGWRLRTSSSSSREGDVRWLWESPARTLQGLAPRRERGGWRLARLATALAKARSVGSGKVRLQRRWAPHYASLAKWRGWRLLLGRPFVPGDSPAVWRAASSRIRLLRRRSSMVPGARGFGVPAPMFLFSGPRAWSLVYDLRSTVFDLWSLGRLDFWPLVI